MLASNGLNMVTFESMIQKSKVVVNSCKIQACNKVVPSTLLSVSVSSLVSGMRKLHTVLPLQTSKASG